MGNYLGKVLDAAILTDGNIRPTQTRQAGADSNYGFSGGPAAVGAQGPPGGKKAGRNGAQVCRVVCHHATCEIFGLT